VDIVLRAAPHTQFDYRILVSKDISISVPYNNFSFARTFADKALKCVPHYFLILFTINAVSSVP